jgi:hypothetical protein
MREEQRVPDLKVGALCSFEVWNPFPALTADTVSWRRCAGPLVIFNCLDDLCQLFFLLLLQPISRFRPKPVHFRRPLIQSALSGEVPHLFEIMPEAILQNQLHIWIPV